MFQYCRRLIAEFEKTNWHLFFKYGTIFENEQSKVELSFTDRVKRAIKQIPKGKVATYGQIATIAGNYRAARQVVRVLHSSSKKDALPWYRVVNKQGKISLLPGNGFEEQKFLLENEDVVFDHNDQIDLEHFLWQPK